jgi:predicted transcriptional regulator
MKTPLRPVPIKMPKKLLEAIERIAEKNNVKKSMVIREAVSRYIEMLEKGITTTPESREALGNMIVTSFKIRKEDLERLDKISRETNISRNMLIRQAIQHYIETIEAQAEKHKEKEKRKEKHIVIKI